MSTTIGILLATLDLRCQRAEKDLIDAAHERALVPRWRWLARRRATKARDRARHHYLATLHDYVVALRRDRIGWYEHVQS